MGLAEGNIGFERHVTRRLLVDERSLVVLDGLFDDRDVAALYAFLRALPYRLNDVDVEETAYSRHWKAEFPIEMAEGMPLFRSCVQAALDLSRSRALRLNRVHANLHLYGDMQFPHVDLPGGVTALYYANPEWKESWLGETVFYDEAHEPLHTVAPKPGRLAIFDGDIVHRAGVPSRECFEPRISVAFKFVPASAMSQRSS